MTTQVVISNLGPEEILLSIGKHDFQAGTTSWTHRVIPPKECLVEYVYREQNLQIAEQARELAEEANQK